MYSVMKYTRSSSFHVFTNFIIWGWSIFNSISLSEHRFSWKLYAAIFFLLTDFTAYNVCLVLCMHKYTVPNIPAPKALIALRSSIVTESSFKIIRTRSCYRTVSSTIYTKSSLLNSHTVTLPIAFTVALRFSYSKTARSPKKSFFAIWRITVSPLSMWTFPSFTM